MRVIPLTVLLVLSLPVTASMRQDPPPPDPVLIQRFIDADTAGRRQIADENPGARTAPFRIELQNIGREHAKQARTKESIRAYEAAIDLGTIIDARRTRISARIGLGAAYGQASDYSNAAKYLQAALDETEIGSDDDLIAAAANNLGNLYRRRGEYDKALEVQMRALASNEAGQRDEQTAKTLNNIGVIYQQQGDFAQSVEYFLRSLAIKERLGPIEEVSSTLGNIGGVYAMQGNHILASEYIERSIVYAEKMNNVRLIVGQLSNLGRVMTDAGEEVRGEAYLTRARDLAEKAGYTEQLASVLTGLGNLAIERRQFDLAGQHLTRARALYSEVQDPPGLGQVLMSMATLDVERGAPESAVKYALEARDTFAAASSVGTPSALIDAEVVYGEALTSLKRWDEAIATFERAIALTERGLDLVAGGTPERFTFLEVSTSAYSGLAHAYASAGRAAEALTAAERGRARTLLDILAGAGPGEAELTDTDRERILELNTALSALNDRLTAERQRALKGARPDPSLPADIDRIRRTRDEFYLGLDARHPRLRFARGGTPVSSAEEIAAALPPRAGLVEFVVGPRGAWVMLLAPRGGRAPVLTLKPIALPPDRLNALASSFSRQVATRDLGFAGNARALYDALLGPIDAALAGVDHLIIVPHAGLWEVPFQALQTPRRRFLIEERAITYAPSASTLKELRARRRVPKSQPRVVAFGDPRLTNANLPALPNAAREARALAEVYGAESVIIATDAEATETRFRELAPRADIVHIATHGILDNGSPLFSYVMLAGGGSARASDGRLDGRELINMELAADLVVLSACETARGRIANGEGVVGLSWALFAAGASTTAVSLWPVDSASTTDLMSAFHRERRRLTLSTSPAPTARAMREAQLRALANAESRHPFYWAGFVVIGVP